MSWEDTLIDDVVESEMKTKEEETLKDIVHGILFEGERKNEYIIPRVLLHSIWRELK
tara:strand:+ start:2313 stop:2483 length:171 start_codon:yes stop_codon:yes gene_type:complete